MGSLCIAKIRICSIVVRICRCKPQVYGMRVEAKNREARAQSCGGKHWSCHCDERNTQVEPSKFNPLYILMLVENEGRTKHA